MSITAIAPFQFTIKYGDLAVTPVQLPHRISTDKKKGIFALHHCRLPSSKNRARGSCKALDTTLGIKMSFIDKDNFRKVCLT
jgi:hypothetical protein